MFWELFVKLPVVAGVIFVPREPGAPMRVPARDVARLTRGTNQPAARGVLHEGEKGEGTHCKLRCLLACAASAADVCKIATKRQAASAHDDATLIKKLICTRKGRIVPG